MNKDEINFNLNNAVITKAAGVGACFWSILYSTPFLVVHPKAQDFILLLLPALFMFDFYTKLKDQNAKNAEIIKNHKIKDYKTPVHFAAITGLIGGGALTFLLQATNFIINGQSPNKSDIFLALWSALFLIYPIKQLKNITEHNKQQIDKIR